MSKANLRKPSSQLKLFIDPALLKDGFDIDLLMQELKIETHALATSAGTALLMLFLSSEIDLMRKNAAHTGMRLYPWGTQPGYLCVG